MEKSTAEIILNSANLIRQVMSNPVIEDYLEKEGKTVDWDEFKNMQREAADTMIRYYLDVIRKVYTK